MARIDPDVKRQEVANAAASVIARRGMEALTIRSVADETGSSIAVVQYYFRNKHDLLVFTYESLALKSQERFQGAAAARPDNLFHMLSAVLPLTPERRESTKAWHAYSSTAAVDPAFTGKVRRITLYMREKLEEALRHHEHTPGFRRPADVGLTARRLLTFAYGIGMEAQFNETDWPEDMQRQALSDNIRDLTGLDYPPDEDIWLD
jgi:AcrR family transcriptional regulator